MTPETIVEVVYSLMNIGLTKSAKAKEKMMFILKIHLLKRRYNLIIK
jgi:hypothetical protein